MPLTEYLVYNISVRSNFEREIETERVPEKLNLRALWQEYSMTLTLDTLGSFGQQLKGCDVWTKSLPLAISESSAPER